MITILALTQPTLTEASSALSSFEKFASYAVPGADEQASRKYLVHWEGVDEIVFYMGLFMIVFGILFYFFVCFGCGYLSCGVSMARNSQTYEQI
ncbi:hypothetical protein ACKWTF_016022 [Chironomus riparius]